MRWVFIFVVFILLNYFGANKIDQAIIYFAIALGYINVDIQDQGKKLTAIMDHSEQGQTDFERRFDAAERASTKTLREVESVASSLHTLEVEIALLRKHLVPDTRRPWDA